ncbi:DivIVA domain-containing protein [Bifidobacterium sp. SO1]|uniref:DivIVA domain-containing protein n=1 Tax=Bifidobacterium sp. SO1 TaxID=2809029 RepID=UPI001BDDA1A8|nr:DivIVA domain-containing protein [Bifidobacterium sp. SO1]MBT1161276.1 hypothetical protein [Bifidobacterium sp. SO1]
MLVTAKQVRQVEFPCKTSVFSRREWYFADPVDEFLDSVADSLQALFNARTELLKERKALLKQISVLQDRITVLEAEKGVNDAGADDE